MTATAAPTCYYSGETLHLEHRITKGDEAAPSVYVHADSTSCQAIVY